MDIITRSQWGFDGPTGPARMNLPSRGVWLHHSVTAPTDNPHADMRTLERIGKQRFGRLSYSYAIHPTGAVLEGQGGWIGAHTHSQNSTSHGLVFIGNWHTRRPPDVMIDAAAELIAHGGTEGWWQPQILGGHRDNPHSATACPGDELYALIPTIQQRAEENHVKEQIHDWAKDPLGRLVKRGYISKVPDRATFEYQQVLTAMDRMDRALRAIKIGGGATAAAVITEIVARLT